MTCLSARNKECSHVCYEDEVDEVEDKDETVENHYDYLTPDLAFLSLASKIVTDESHRKKAPGQGNLGCSIGFDGISSH